MQASTSLLALETAMKISESGLLFILEVCETNIALRCVEHKMDLELKQLIALVSNYFEDHFRLFRYVYNLVFIRDVFRKKLERKLKVKP